MSRNAEITLAWGDGDHRFRLGWGELELLQEECDAGPYVIADRLRDRPRAVRLVDGSLLGVGGDVALMLSLDGEVNPPMTLPPQCSAKEVAAVLRLGLIGGGMKPGEALKLVRTYVENRPIEDNRSFAFAVLQVAIYGAPEERLGEPDAPSQAEAESQNLSQTEN